MSSLSFNLTEDSRTARGERVYRDDASTLLVPRTYLTGRSVSSSVDGASSIWVRTTFRALNTSGEALKQPVVVNTSVKFSNSTDIDLVLADTGNLGAYRAHLAVLGCDEMIAAIPDMGFPFPVDGYTVP
jgi:hypothetical protein